MGRVSGPKLIHLVSKPVMGNFTIPNAPQTATYIVPTYELPVYRPRCHAKNGDPLWNNEASFQTVGHGHGPSSTVIFQAVGEVPEDFPTSQPCKEALRQGYASRKSQIGVLSRHRDYAV